MRRAKFLSRPILVESGWNWNLKFGFLGQYGQKFIFQFKWMKNTDELKIYLLWFSSIENCLKRKRYKIFVIFTSFQFKIIYMSTFGKFWVISGFVCVALIYFFFIIKHEPLLGEARIEIESVVAKQTKKCDFVSKHSASDNFLPPSKEHLKTHFEFSFGININFICSNSP